MQAPYLPNSGVDTLLDPGAPAWGSVPREQLKLEGTPLGLQPSSAIRSRWMERKIGNIDRVEVAAAHDGRDLAFRLEWDDATENGQASDSDQFPDAAAVLLPTVPGASIVTMGGPGGAVNAWYWRADADGGRHVVAEGIGSSRTLDGEWVRGRGIWKAGRWQVVIARALRIDTPEPVAQLEPGQKTGLAIAVWDGANGERAGIKAYSGPTWRDLVLDAMPAGRRS